MKVSQPQFFQQPVEKCGNPAETSKTSFIDDFVINYGKASKSYLLKSFFKKSSGHLILSKKLFSNALIINENNLCINLGFKSTGSILILLTSF